MVVCTDTITKDLTEVLLYQGTDRTSFTPTADPGQGMVVCIDKHPLFAETEYLFLKELIDLPPQNVLLELGKVQSADSSARSNTVVYPNLLYVVELYREYLYEWADAMHIYNAGLEAQEIFRKENCPNREETLP